jgi:hypothetical protein
MHNPDKEEVHPLVRKKREDRERDGGIVAKLRRSVADLLEDPETRRKARRGGEKLANDPRVRRAGRELLNRVAQRLRRR